MFDAGEGTQVSLKRLSLKWKKIDAIFVSHTHADHVTGIPGLMMLESQVERTDPLYIYGPPNIKEYIEASRKTLDMFINYPVIIKEISAPCIVHSGEGFYIRAFPLKHSKTCVGYTLEELDRPGEFFPEKATALNVPRGPLWRQLQQGSPVENAQGKTVSPQDVMGPKRQGRKFSFVTDTLYLPSVAKEVQGSDLLVCEGMFAQDCLSQAKEKKHQTAKQAALIAKDAKVTKLALIHYSPRYTDTQLDVLLQEAKQIFPNTVLSHDRMCFDLPYID